MSNNKQLNPVDDIIDLTEVVSIGSGVGVANDNLQADDVLDSLVHEFEDKKENSEIPLDDGSGLDLSNLDNLIRSYNLDFDENKNQENELDGDFDAILNDIKLEKNESEEKEPFFSHNDMLHGLKDGKQTDSDNNSELKDTVLPLQDDEIEQLTRDIIDGPSLGDKEIFKDAAADDEITDLGVPLLVSEQQESDDVPDSFLDELDKQLGNEKDLSDSADLSGSAGKAVDFTEIDSVLENSEEKILPDNLTENVSANVSALVQEPDEKFDAAGDKNSDGLQILQQDDEKSVLKTETLPSAEKNLSSDMVNDEAEDISDDAFNDILNELSLDHENDEDVVAFAKDASEETIPIHLKGDVSFIENQGGAKASADVSLVQSASKVLNSDEAYLEKFDGEDESIGAKLKALSNNFTSLEHRFLVSDSKNQDAVLEINYRISGLETRVSALEENTKNELTHLKSSLDNFSRSLEDVSQKTQSPASGKDEKLLEKVQALETRVATLDDIFSEQKMLNDELAKTLDSHSAAAGGAEAENIRALEEKIAALQNELALAQSKLTVMEENIEKMASLAAAKVLREEIIPLLSKE